MKFEIRLDLRKHRVQHGGKPYQEKQDWMCTICGKVLKTKWSYKLHANVHEINDDKSQADREKNGWVCQVRPYLNLNMHSIQSLF